jgi:hypothetical protein
MVGRREENVGVEKKAIHQSGIPVLLFRRTMRNHIWIQTKPFHFFPRTLVIFLIRGIREQKFRLAFGGISFHGHDNCRPNEDSVIARLGGDEGTFLDAVAFPQFGGDDDRSALAHFYRVHGCQFIRISEFRANRFPRYLARCRDLQVVGETRRDSLPACDESGAQRAPMRAQKEEDRS